MKNKRGFTLIELLSVIVILAIIALIATPIVLNTIANSRKNAAKDSVFGYIEAIESQNALHQVDSEKYQEITSGDVTSINSKIKVKGTKPTSGTVTIEKGVVTQASMCVNDYMVSYDGKEVTNIEKGCGQSSNEQAQQPSTYPTYEPGNLVYFDPVSSTQCDSEHQTSETCYKWRIITVGDNDTKENITIQMDHNLTSNTDWISKDDYNDNDNYGSYGNTNKGPITVLKLLESETSGWTRVSGLTYSYDTSLNGTNTGVNYGTLSCTNGVCTVANNEITSNLKARIITGEEVRELTMNEGAESGSLADNWTLKTPKNWYYFSSTRYALGTKNGLSVDNPGNTNLSWLLENTRTYNYSGATTDSLGRSIWGYYTLSPVFDGSGYVWVLDYDGYFSYYRRENAYLFYGARPVITISKSMLAS